MASTISTTWLLRAPRSPLPTARCVFRQLYLDRHLQLPLDIGQSDLASPDDQLHLQPQRHQPTAYNLQPDQGISGSEGRASPAKQEAVVEDCFGRRQNSSTARTEAGGRKDVVDGIGVKESLALIQRLARSHKDTSEFTGSKQYKLPTIPPKLVDLCTL
jgi:hypothetical protein